MTMSSVTASASPLRGTFAAPQPDEKKKKKKEDPVPPGRPKRGPVKEPPHAPLNPDPTPIDDPRPPKPKRLSARAQLGGAIAPEKRENRNQRRIL